MKKIRETRVPSDPVTTKPRPSRNGLVSWLAYLVGGWNATAGVSPGRLLCEPVVKDDEKLARHFIETIERDTRNEFEAKISRLHQELHEACTQRNDHMQQLEDFQKAENVASSHRIAELYTDASFKDRADKIVALRDVVKALLPHIDQLAMPDAGAELAVIKANEVLKQTEHFQ